MQKVFFVPRYIASLKYYERLFPLIRESGAEPAFVLFEDLGMLAYVKEHGLAYERVIPRTGRIPFISHIRAFDTLRTNVRALLKREHDAVFVTEGRLPDTMKLLVAEAAKTGTRVLALQWCMHSSHAESQERSLARTLRRMRGRDGTLLKAIPRSVYFLLLRGVFRTLDLLARERYVFSELPAHIGVFDEYAREYFRAHGYPASAIEVVGNYDVERAEELTHTLTAEKRATRRAMLGIPEGKRSVLLLSTIFYTGNASVCMSKEENIAYYRSLIEDIRVSFGESAAIIFKLHPREYADAACYTDLARVVTQEADAEELAILADLYIAHPISVVNMTARAAGTASLIVNFTPLTYMNDFAPTYGIRHIIAEREEFRSALRDIARGSVPETFDPAPTAGGFAVRLCGFLTL